MGYKSPHVYALRLDAAYTATIADSLTYYMGCIMSWALTTNADNSRVYILRRGFIRRINLFFYASTPSSAENIEIYIRINNTTDYLVTATGKFNGTRISISNALLNIPVAEGDYFEVKFIMPAFATNPAGVSSTGDVLIECE